VGFLFTTIEFRFVRRIRHPAKLSIDIFIEGLEVGCEKLENNSSHLSPQTSNPFDLLANRPEEFEGLH